MLQLLGPCEQSHPLWAVTSGCKPQGLAQKRFHSPKPTYTGVLLKICMSLLLQLLSCLWMTISAEQLLVQELGRSGSKKHQISPRAPKKRGGLEIHEGIGKPREGFKTTAAMSVWRGQKRPWEECACRSDGCLWFSPHASVFACWLPGPPVLH